MYFPETDYEDADEGTLNEIFSKEHPFSYLGIDDPEGKNTECNGILYQTKERQVL